MKYFVLRHDWEYMTDSTGGYDTRVSRAARIREHDIPRLKWWAERLDVNLPEIIPTTHKPNGIVFFDTETWAEHMRRLINSR